MASVGGSNGGGFDLAVVGAGSGGFSAAITAAELGANVALIGHGTIGGTCVNVGCVPSKTLIRAAEALHNGSAALRFAGIGSDARIDDWAALIAQKDELVSSLRQAKYEDVLPTYNGIAYVAGQARLSETGVSVDGSVIEAKSVIIATGASPSPPDIPGIDTVPTLNSTTAMALEALPRSLLVIGGGYIGCELGQMFARVGTAVTIVCRSRLLPEAEPEISQALSEYLAAEGVTIWSGVAYQDIRQTETGVALTVARGGEPEVLVAEQVLVTAGRRPNTRGLGLEEAGVALTDRGAIVVDDRMRTSRPATYAAGDVTGRDEFVYMAAYGARLAAENALNGDAQVYDSSVMPWVVFTDPQVAGVGLTERAAAQAGFKTKTSVLPLAHVPRALAARDTRGLIKLVADADTDRLLGAHIIAPEGADSIQTATLALKYGMTVRDLAATIFPYLTTVEGLQLAAQTFDKDVSKLSCCAG
ncbi:MAG: mercury(II) reductase [Alphaproteobacteria bacterium]